MLLQTNSYVVPKERRSEHTRLVRRFRQVLLRLGCDQFEVYEQVGTNWTSDQSSGRFVQIMRFRDRKHQLAIQAAERDDPTAQAVIAEFCELINFPYQQQQGLFAIGYYTGILGSGKLLAAPDEAAHVPPAPRAASTAHQPAPAPLIVGAGEPMTMVVEQSQLVGLNEDDESAAAGPIRNPFAESPIVAPAQPPVGHEVASEPAPVVGSNGNGHPHAPVAGPFDEPEVDEFGDAPPMVSNERDAGDNLDELIKKHFGGEAESRVERDAEPSEEPLPGSGIGAVLDASLYGDDPDLDIALPAELLEPPDSSVPHTSEPARHHHHGDEADHA